MTKDLTSGSPMKLILGFALPTLIGILFQQFYSLVDTAIVGNLLDTSALAAVGTTGSLNFMVIGFIVGLGNGFAIPVSQRMGAGQHSMMRKYVANSYWLAGGFSIAVTLLVCVLCRQILIAMQIPEDIFERSYQYIFVIFLGIPAIFLYNLLASLIRALGDSKTPVYFLALASVMNIILDYIFIVYTPLGVAGAALATVISQSCSGIACLFYMKKKFPILKMTAEEKKINGVICKNLCFMGIPMGLQFSITAIGNVILQTAVNGLGSSTMVGALSTSGKLSIFFWAPFDSLGSTISTFCGQNVGAMKLDRLGKGIKSACLLGAIYSIFAFAILWFFGEDLLMLFLNEDEGDLTEFMNYAKKNLYIMNAFMIILCILIVTRFAIQGMGFSTFAMLAGVMEMISRTCVALFLVPVWGYDAACFGAPIAWIAAIAFLIPASYGCIKKLKTSQIRDDNEYLPPEEVH
ncbi:MAG: MATE family efflux transporter [Eubacteriales bacterium]